VYNTQNKRPGVEAFVKFQALFLLFNEKYFEPEKT
jgi:hypothetical protein